MASAIRKFRFTAVRKPIYCVEIDASGKEFRSAFEVVEAFKKRRPEFENCKYDYEYLHGMWQIRLYRECAIDFI
jgi:hypothetical protein